jgi:hypothetical protein
VNVNDVSALMLLGMQGIALGVGIMVLGWMMAVHRREQIRIASLALGKPLSFKTEERHRPSCWLAIRSVTPEAVMKALRLDHASPCSWAEGLAGDHEFFISPRLNGWIIVTGLGLPNPTDDVDGTFLFLTALSRQVGHVQYFYASRLLHHHAWARLDDGCVTRAYAWAGETVWNQGVETLPEAEAGVRLHGYGEPGAPLADAETNFEKVPHLAARWSLDPAAVKLNAVRQAIGMAGDSTFH